MGASKVVSPWPTSPLPLGLYCANNLTARAEVIRTLAGNAATLNGWTYGGALLDNDTANPAPPCPGHGKRGHDHSGGLFGRPLFRTVASYTFARSEEYSANIDGNDESPNATTITSIPASTTGLVRPVIPAFPIWVPGCDPGQNGAYTQMAIRAVGYISASTNTAAGDQLGWKVKNRTTGGRTTTSDATITATGYTSGTSGASPLFFAPGRVNILEIEGMVLTTIAGGAARTVTASLTTLEIGVYST